MLWGSLHRQSGTGCSAEYGRASRACPRALAAARAALTALRQPGESYSDVILRLVEAEAKAGKGEARS